MRIAVLPADQSGCGSFRLSWPAEVVRTVRPDWNIELYAPDTVQIASNPDGSVRAVKGMDPHGLDLILIQRVGLPGPAKFLDWVQEQGTAVIVDSDDAIWAIDRENASFKAWNHPTGMSWRWLDYASDRADRTTVTTPYLAKRYGKHGRYSVLPNRIPQSVLEIESARDQYPDQVAVGWMGFTRTHPRDLDVVGDAVRLSAAETGIGARVVGDADGASTTWGVPVEALGSFKLGAELYRAMTSIDIGLVPLRESPFNRGKSSLKAMEFSALGKPVIASPTPANKDLARDLPILLAESPREWREHIVRLARDESERLERGRSAQRIIAESYTIEGSAERWAEAWEKAVERRRSVAGRTRGRKRAPVLSR